MMMTRKAVLFVTAIFLLGSPGAQSDPTYHFADLVPNIERMLSSKADDAFFVIEIAGSPDFVQMYGSDGTAYLNFPMVTQRQKSLRSEVVQICEELGLDISTYGAANGSENLDCALPKKATEIGVILEKLLNRIYSVNEDTPLRLEANGFKLTAA